MSERRRSSRFPIDAPARLEPVGGGHLQAQAYSLALGGVTLRSQAALEPGRGLVLELQLPLGDAANRLRAQCRVTRCTVLDPGPGYRVAVTFERLDQRAMALLQRYFATHRRQAGGGE